MIEVLQSNRAWGYALLALGLLLVLCGGLLARPSQAQRTWPGLGHLQFAPDGALIGSDGVRSTWYDLTSSKPVARFTLTSDGAIQSMAISPDSQWFATGTSRGTISLWSVPERRLVTQLQVTPLNTGQPIISSVAFSPDGRTMAWIAFYRSPGIDLRLIYQLWDYAHATSIYTTDLLSDGRGDYGFGNVQFSPDGQYSIWSGYALEVRRVGDHSLVYRVEPAPPPADEIIGEVVVSPDQQWLIQGARGKLTIRRFSDGQVVREILPPTRNSAYPPDLHVAVSPDSRYVAAGAAYSSSSLFVGAPNFKQWEPVRLWSIETGQQVQVFAGHLEGAFRIVYSPDGRFLATNGEGGTRLWPVAPGNPWVPLLWISGGLLCLLGAIARWAWLNRAG
jgi:WD40 repeat protein